MLCIVCGSDNFNKIYDSLLKCGKCGYTVANMELFKDYTDKIYDDSYFFGNEYLNYRDEKIVLQKNFARYLNFIIKYAPSGKLLEVGSAYGYFLELAGRCYEASGIDVNEGGCRHAKEELKLNVTCGDLLKEEYKENSYDVIVAWATLEHLPAPELYIEKISRLLKQGGIFACSTPDIGSLLARVQGKNWRQIHPPTHISYFSRKTLSALLQNNNLDTICIESFGECRTVDLVLYTILSLKSKFAGLYALLKKIGLTQGHFYLNTFDTMYLIARKK